MSIVSRIKEVAKSRGTSIPELEVKLNFGKNAIYSWDEYPPGSRRLLEVADELGSDFRYLSEGEATLFDIPIEEKQLLKDYYNLTPEQKAPIKDLFNQFEDQYQEGRRNKTLSIATKLIQNNTAVEDIMDYTDLDIGTIQRLKEELEL